jgi:hypothetical protein
VPSDDERLPDFVFADVLAPRIMAAISSSRVRAIFSHDS